MSTSDENGNYIKKRLRPEARPIDWSQLNERQREAFRRTLYSIEEAVDGLSSRKNNNCRNDQNGGQSRLESQLLQNNRSSNSVFISGRRGSGKSSVLLSLMKYALKQNNEEIKYSSERLAPAIRKLKRRVIWLELIDMDPLPNPFSLLPSILERIDQALKRFRNEDSTHIQISGVENHEMWHEFRNLYTDATLAWDTNIVARQGQLDPDYYSQELQRTNRARLSLNRRFNKVLQKLGKQAFGSIENPLFVVTIDDFDMHPAACVNVLKMLRMLSVPRLFFIMLGDINLLEIMSDLSASREIGQVIRDVSKTTLGVEAAQIRTLTTSISRTSLRKLIPMDQRIYLENASIVEGMTYRPPYLKSERGEYWPRIGALTANIPLTVQSAFLENQGSSQVCGTPVLNLLDYLLHPGFFVFQEKEDQLQVSYPCKIRIDSKSAGVGNRKKMTLKERAEKEREAEEDKSRQRLDYFQKLHLPFTDKLEIALFSTFDRKGFEKTDSISAYDIKNYLSERGGSVAFPSSRKPFGKLFAISETPKNKTPIEAMELLDNEVKEYFFWGINLFKSTPRRIADLWFAFRRHVDRVTRVTNDLANSKNVEDIDSVFDRLEHTFLRELGRVCRDCLLEENVFTPLERSRIEAAFTPSSFGDWNWSQLPVQLLSISEAANRYTGTNWARNRHRVPVKLKGDHAVRNLYHEVRAFKISDWTVVGEESGDYLEPGDVATRAGTKRIEKIDSSRELSSATTALLMIFHDFLRLGQKGTRFESTLIPFDDGTLEFGRRIPKQFDFENASLDEEDSFDHDSLPNRVERKFDDNELVNRESTSIRNERRLESEEARHFFAQDQVWCKWAATLHQSSFREVQEIYWPAPGLLSIWGLDMFRRCWNHTIDTVNNRAYKRIGAQASNTSPITDKERVEGLAFGWIAAGCAVAAAKEPVTCRGVPQNDDWEKLFIELNQLASKYFDECDKYETEKTKGLKYWLQNVAVLLMPETGLPSRLMFHLLFGLSVNPTDPGFFGAIKKTSDFKTQRKSYIADNIKEYLHYEVETVEELHAKLSRMAAAIGKKKGRDAYVDIYDFEFWRNESGRAGEKLSVTKKNEKDKTEIKMLLALIKGEEVKGKGSRKLGNFASAKSLQTAKEEIGTWLRGFPFVRFVNEFRVDLRARRGVRLELLKNIAKGFLSERLRRSHCLHLFDHVQRKTTDLNLGGEFGEDFGYEQLSQTVFTLGATFGGGGLVPHENELGYSIPDFRKRRKRKEKEKDIRNRNAVFIKCMNKVLDEVGVKSPVEVTENNSEVVREILVSRNKKFVEEAQSEGGDETLEVYFSIRAFWGWQSVLDNPNEKGGPMEKYIIDNVNDREFKIDDLKSISFKIGRGIMEQQYRKTSPVEAARPII